MWRDDFSTQACGDGPTSVVRRESRKRILLCNQSLHLKERLFTSQTMRQHGKNENKKDCDIPVKHPLSHHLNTVSNPLQPLCHLNQAPPPACTIIHPNHSTPTSRSASLTSTPKPTANIHKAWYPYHSRKAKRRHMRTNLFPGSLGRGSSLYGAQRHSWSR